ncbi:MAG TPA: ABC transporter substrate-binding protein [Acidimicrobiales bacterium]|nr:ABC transporter substrate-binding protein [Acidimicrobiales bacterium]
MQRHTKVLAGLLALSLLGAACGDDDDDDAATEDESGGAEVPDGPPISIGAQDFGESLILSEIYAGALSDGGYNASTTEVGGFRDLLFGAFESGDVNMAIDYVASELEFLNDGAGQATSDVNTTLAALEPLLEPMDIVAAAPSAAVDTNAFVITQETSDSLDITTLSDLAEKGADLTLGAPPDCESNGFCIPGLLRVYGVDFTANFTPLDFGVIPDSLDEGAVDIGVVGSTDGRLADESTGWVLLEDDKGMFAADNVFPIVSQEVVDAYGDDLITLLDEVSGKLTTEDLIDMNKRYDVDREDADDIAADWLSDNGFGG